MQCRFGSDHLTWKKRKLYNNVKHMLLMPAGTYVRFLPLVAAFDPAHEGGLRKGPIRPGAQSASAACQKLTTNSRLFLVLHAPATPHYNPFPSCFMTSCTRKCIIYIVCIHIYIYVIHTQSHMYVVQYIIIPCPNMRHEIPPVRDPSWIDSIINHRF